jgi:transposase InsO family protein
MRAPNARLGAPPTPCRGSATAANDPPAHGHKIYPYLLRNLTIERANHVWAADITYIPIGRGFLCLVAIIHWPSRAVLAWRLPIQTNCVTIAAQRRRRTIMAAIRRQMCSVGDKRSPSKTLTLSIVGWRSESPPGVRPCPASAPLPILLTGASTAPRVFNRVHEAFQKRGR